MYCINCGNKLKENSNYCTSCGNKLNINKKEDTGFKTASIILGILSIIASITIIFLTYGFIMSIVGFILAIISLKKSKNTLGIVLNIIGFILSILAGIILCIFILRIANNHNKYQYEYNDNYIDKFKDIIEKY